MGNITLTCKTAEYEAVKHELLGDYFQEKVERGEISFFRALLAEHKIAQDVAESEKDMLAGRYEAITPEFLEQLKR